MLPRSARSGRQALPWTLLQLGGRLVLCCRSVWNVVGSTNLSIWARKVAVVEDN